MRKSKNIGFVAWTAALLSLAACVRNVYAGDWPMFRGDAARTGYSAEQAAPPLAKVWEFQAAGAIVSSPVVYDGRVYVGTRANKIYALDVRTGAKLWERLTAGWVDSSPAVYGNTVYATCLGGRLYALDRLSGRPLWIADLGAASASSPLVLGGRVYAGTGSPENRLKVYDAATGAPLGSYRAGQPVDSAPATDGQRVYFGANDGAVYALDPVSLAPAWPAYPTMGAFGMNAVAVSSGALYFLPGRDDKRASALDAAAGTLLAMSPQLSKTGPWTQASSPAVDPYGALYFSAGAAEAAEEVASMAALSTSSLTAVWPSSASLGGISALGILSSPALANEVVFAGTPGGRLIARSTSGASLADLDVSSPSYSSPAVSNGMVVAANYGGRVYGFLAARRAAISSPARGAVVSGVLPVRAWLAGPELSGYELEYSTGGQLPQWVRISSGALAASVDGTELSAWDVSGLPNGNYELRLRALESAPSGYDASSVAGVRVNAVPLPPQDLVAADVPGDYGNTLSLTWTASPSQGIVSYRVYRQAEDEPGFSLLTSTSPSPLYFTDHSAVTGSTYTYTLRAWDGVLESSGSAEAYAFSVNDSGDSEPPAAVTDLAAEPGGAPGQVLLTWTATGNDGNVGSASNYVVKYATYPGFAPSGFDAPALSSAVFEAGGPAGIDEAAEIGGLLAGVTYYFAIRPYDASLNAGGVSGEVSAYASYDTIAPLPPSALSVEDTPGDGGGSLSLSWTLSPDDGGGAGDVYGYKVYRRLLNASYVSSAPYAEVGRGVSSYRDPDVTDNVRYYYSVAAFDSTLNSALAAEAYGVSADNYRFMDASQGGYVRLPDGARVDIAAGAVSQNDGIMFIRVDPSTYAPLAGVKAAPGANPTSVVYEVKFKNAATHLTGRAVLSLPYSEDDVAGMETENLRIYTLSGGSWVMLNTSSVDAANRRVSAEVNRFSIFRIMEYVPAGSLLNSAEVYTYPNPAKGDSVTFKFKLAYKSHVKIEVYNIAGEKVASFERADCPAGQASEIVWNVRKTASGVYVFRLEAASAAGSKTVTRKFAIAH